MMNREKGRMNSLMSDSNNQRYRNMNFSKLFKKSLLSCFIGLTLAETSLITGCTALHSEYVRPELNEYVFKNGKAPAVLSNADKASASDANENATSDFTDSFWVKFADPKLTAIIEEALKSNNDYYQALINVKKARVQANITDSALIPDLDASLSSGLKKPLKSAHSSRSSSSSLNVGYEVDIFGRLSADSKSAAYTVEAKEYDAETARLTVSAEVARLYWQIVYYKDAVRLSENNLKDSEDTFRIMQSRYDTGKISELELVQAKTDLLEINTTLAEQKSRLDNSVSALNLLLNRVPDAKIDTAESLKDLKVPEVSAGLGSDLLRNRPDVASAEAQVKSALASTDAARLDMYPRFNLTAGLSAGSSTELVQFFENPVASIIASLSMPFINYYKNSLHVDMAELEHDSAEMKFVTTYYKALGEVYQALNDIELDGVLLKNNYDKLQLNKKTEELYRQKYDAGSVSLKDYLDSKKSRRAAALILCKTKQDALNNVAVLAKAMGGL